MTFLEELESSYDPFEYRQSSRKELVSRIISQRKEWKSRIISNRAPRLDDDDDDDYDYPPLDVDDFVVDCPPRPDLGCRRTHRISSSDVRINLGVPVGPTYIFVQGRDLACIVTRRGLNPGQEEPQDLYNFKRILMSLADPRFDDSAMRSLDSHMIKKLDEAKHCAVVSVCMSANEINQKMENNKILPSIGMKEVVSHLKGPLCVSSHERSAVEMLRVKLENEASFPRGEEIIQTAIAALQRLYGKNVEAHEIWVYYASQDKKKIFLARDEIERHLTVINNGTP